MFQRAIPLSAKKFDPVIPTALSPARYRAKFAISSGFDILFSGTLKSTPFSASGAKLAFSQISLYTGPGLIVFTLTP